jgi:hypothetical protein
VFQPVKVYPFRIGGLGREPMFVEELVTVFVTGSASVSPPFLSKATV